MLRTTFLLMMLIVINYGFAQNTGLLPNQNPNYKISEEKYTRFRDSLLLNSNSTIQDTYKAYDWFEEKTERRNNRRDNRRQRNFYGNNQLGFNDWGSNGGFNNWGWNNRFNNRFGNNNRWGNSFNPWFNPNIGFRTGNWFFGF